MEPDTEPPSAHQPQPQPGAVISRIIQRPRPDKVAEYELWLKEISAVARSFPGHCGVNIIRPHGSQRDYTIALHFESEASLRNWFNSAVRRELVEKGRPLLSSPESIEIQTGFEFWFTPPPAQRSAPPFKQFLLTLSAIYPLSLLVPWVLGPIFQALHLAHLPLLTRLLATAVIVALMVYLIMPRYVRAVSRWLYR